MGRDQITQWLLVLVIDGLFPKGNKKPLIGRKLWSDIMGFVFLKNNNLSGCCVEHGLEGGESWQG